LADALDHGVVRYVVIGGLRERVVVARPQVLRQVFIGD